ncbi:MAG: TolC family protein [Bacteroidota bacterium]
MSSVVAQQKQTEYTLSEALKVALEHNLKVINAKRGIKAAQKRKWETIAAGLPHLDGNVDYQNQLKQVVSLVPAEFTGGTPGTFVPVFFGQSQQINANVTLSQLLFDGSYLVGVQATKAFNRSSSNALERTTLEVRKAVVEQYATLLLARTNVSLLTANLNTLEKDLFEIDQVYKNGFAEQEAVEQLKIRVNLTRNNLSNAQRLDTISTQMLNYTLGKPFEETFTPLNTLEELAAYSIEKGLLESDPDVHNSIVYKIAANLKEQRYYELKLAKSQALPKLSAFVNYGATAFNDSFGFLQSDQKWFEASILGVSLKVPLFSSFERKAKSKRAAIALEQAKTRLKDTELQLELQLKEATSNYDQAVASLEHTKENLALSTRIADKNRIKFFEGIGSSFDFRAAQLQLYQSQGEYLGAMQQVINSTVELITLLNLEEDYAIPIQTKVEMDTIAALKASQEVSEISTLSKEQTANKQTTTKNPQSDYEGQNEVIQTRSISEVEPGYYLIANVFAKPSNQQSFSTTLKQKGLSPNCFFDSNRKLYYVYLGKYKQAKQARAKIKNRFENQYPDTLWILKIQ